MFSSVGTKMNRIPLYTGVLLIMFTLVACGIETKQTSETVLQMRADTDNEYAVMAAIYSDQRTPDGFYQESLPDADQYTIHHVKNTALLAGGMSLTSPVYELSSNDFTESLQWSESAALQRATYRQLVDNTETDLYFQFTRFDPDDPVQTHYYRVFKDDALDRSGYDKNNPGDYQGKIMMPMFTAEQVKYIIEYLWQFTYSNNYGNAVLESYTSETGSEYTHIMNEARLTMGVDGGCDTIKVFEIQYTVQKGNGKIWKNEYPMYQFSSAHDNSEYLLCEQAGS